MEHWFAHFPWTLGRMWRSESLITLDASPWGLRGIIIVSFLSSPLSNVDSQILGHTIGEASGQQVWESLSALVALRAWKSYWTKDRTKLLIRGDSVTMLTMVLCLKPSTFAWPRSACARIGSGTCRRCLPARLRRSAHWMCHKISLPIGCLAKQPLVEQAIDQRFFNSLQKL